MFFCSSGLDIYSKRGVAERRLPRMPSPAQHNCLAMQPMRGGTEWPMALNWSSTRNATAAVAHALSLVDPCPPSIYISARHSSATDCITRSPRYVWFHGAAAAAAAARCGSWVLQPPALRPIDPD
jgi:hypothetical protein